MGRTFEGIEKGIDIYAENGALQVRLLSGTAVPDGLGDQSDAPIGSLYVRSGTGELYQKIANAGNSADYELNGAGGSTAIGNWRPERVDANTGQVLSAGATDPTGWSDNDGGFDGTDATVGHYVLDGNCDLWEITVVGGATSITLAAATTAPAEDDMFAVRYNLPDPAGQENQAIITYDGSACIKVADVDFAVATGINLSAGYTPGSGNPVPSESVESAIQKIDGNNDNQDTLIGTAQGATDLGTFTGSTISDSSTVKGALQELETAYEDTDQNVDDLITLSGRPENSTDQGTMSGGDILSDAATENALFLEIDAELTRQRGKAESLAVTALTVVDSVLVDNVSAADWLVTIEDVSTQKSAHFRVFAGHDGSSDGATDATGVDDTMGKILKIGGNFNYSVSIDINGTGGAQVMRLSVSSSEGSGVNVFTKREEVLF